MVGLYPLIFSLILIAIFSALEIFLIWSLNRPWWKIKAVRWAAFILPAFGIISVVIWYLGMYYGYKLLGRIASISVSTSLILLLALMLSLPISGILNIIHILLEKRKHKKIEEGSEKFSPNRRIFLRATAVALPVVTLSTGASGVASAFQDTNVYLLPMEFENLPSRLAGLRILHMTDSHLGIYKFLHDIETILLKAEEFHPDLILYTGDISDSLPLLPDTLNLVAGMKTKYGVYASIGNHEYYRGIGSVLKSFDKAPVPLLRNSGTTIYVDNYPLYLAGADDPRRLGYDDTDFLDNSIRRAITSAPPNSFKILMSHRPEALGPASKEGINLVLSGHTHGGQVGLAGRSFFAPFMSDRFLWGKYQIDKTQMYLSCGIGHWFPFRLWCPPEAPVIELRGKS
jgi:predicted MPP superfamily phosphohydrolase